MRQYKTVVRILLILSAVNYTFASLAQSWAMHEARTDLVKVTEELEKRQTPSEEGSEGSEKWSTAGKVHPRDEVVEPASEANPEDKFFNKEMDAKIKEYYVLATILALSTGASRGVQNHVSGAVDPHGYVFSTYIPRLPTLYLFEL
jgi:hypothetical protein